MRALKPAGDPHAGPEDPVSQQKRVKKRIQNRNAQRSFREKQAAYVRTLEKMVNQVAPAGSTVSDEGASGARTQASWVEEIQELQDALLRMRRRCQSLSLAAASNADDRIFQRILNRESDPQNEAAQSPESPRELTTTNISSSVESTFHSAAHADDWAQENDLSALFSENYLNDDPMRSGTSFTQSESIRPLMTQPNLTMPSCTTLSLMSPSMSSSIDALRLQDVYNSVDVLGVERTLKTAIKQCCTNEEIQRSVRLAVRIMLKQSPLLEGIFSILGGSEAVESIIHWRIAPTLSNRDKIPPPFRPTVLQQHIPNHHHTIDFLFWAELRDQILLCNDIDMFQLSEDCLKNLVQEVPQLNLSLPVVETYAHLEQLARTQSGQQSLSPVEQVLDLTESDDSQQPLNPQCKVFRAVHKYQLDRLSGRRLSPKFAEKYPTLDVTSFITHLPIASFG